MTKANEIFLSIVIPAYNEEKRIGKSLEKIFNYLKGQSYRYEVIVSDDGSKDSTKEIVRKTQESWPELQLLENKHKGKAPAVISGIKHSNGRNILFTDVDLSVAIEEVGRMLVWTSEHGYDVAIASREGEGANRVDEPASRHFLGRVFNVLVQLVVLPGINDTQCGFKLFSQKSASEIFKRTKLYSDNSEEISGAKVSGFDVEILYIAKKLGYKIKEVPVTWVYKDESKVHSIKDSYYNFMDVMRVRWFSLTGQYDFKMDNRSN